MGKTPKHDMSFTASLPPLDAKQGVEVKPTSRVFRITQNPDSPGQFRAECLLLEGNRARLIRWKDWEHRAHAIIELEFMIKDEYEATE